MSNSNRSFAFAWFLALLALSVFASATVTFNTTAGAFSPINFYNSTNITGQSFTFNVTNETGTLIVYNFSIFSNFSGTWAENTTNTSSFAPLFQTASGSKNLTINVTGMAQGFFVWAIQVWANDTTSALTRAIMGTNMTLIVDTTAPNVTSIGTVGGIQVANNTNFSTQSVTFNVSAKDNVLLANASIFWASASQAWHRNATNSSLTSINNNTPILVTVSNLPANTSFNWTMEACDVAGNCGYYNANLTAIVDLTGPNVTTVNTANFLNASSQSITFNVTVKDNVQIANVSIFGNFTNGTGVWQLNATNSSLTAIHNNTPILVTVTNIPANVSFPWNAQACDVAGNCAQYNANQTAIVDLTGPNVTSFNSPANQHNSSSASITFNVTVADNVQLANVSIFHNATGTWHRNATNSSLTAIHNNTPILVTVSNLPEANRSFIGVEACDVAGNCAFYNANRSVIIDLTPPSVQIVNFSKTSDTTAFLNVSIFDLNWPLNGTIISLASTGGTVNFSNNLTLFPATTANTSGYYNVTLTNLGYDTYTVKVQVNDSANNRNTSASASMTISAPASSSTAGSSGGGGYSSGSASASSTATPVPSTSASPSPSAAATPSATPQATAPKATPSPSALATPKPAPAPAPAGTAASSSEAISGASGLLSSAKAAGSDVSAAESLLGLASQAQAAGNYAAAQQYAQQAKQLLEASATGGTPAPSVKAASSSNNALPIVGAIVVLAALGYLAYTRIGMGGGQGKK